MASGPASTNPSFIPESPTYANQTGISTGGVTSSYENVQSPASSVDARRPAGGAQLSVAGTEYEMVNRDQIKDDDHVYTALKC